MALENGHPMSWQPSYDVWLFWSNFIIRGSPNELLYTYMYTSMLTQTGMCALYFYKVRSHQVTFVWIVRGNVESKWTWQWFIVTISSIWVDEEYSGSDKLHEGKSKKLKKKGSDDDGGAHGKSHKGEDSESHIGIDNLSVSVSNSVLDIMELMDKQYTGSMRNCWPVWTDWQIPLRIGCTCCKICFCSTVISTCTVFGHQWLIYH